MNQPIVNALRVQRNRAMDDAANNEAQAVVLENALNQEMVKREQTYKMLQSILAAKEMKLPVIQELISGDPGFAAWAKAQPKGEAKP